MRPPTPIPESRRVELAEFRKNKWTGFVFQRFLCVWLRVEQGLSTAEISRALGWHVNTVRFTQKDFIERGILALGEGKRGGRHRQLMSPEEEASFFKEFEDKAQAGHILVANEIKDALEKRLGRSVHKTTVYRMMKRQAWRKVAPRPTHPKRDEKAVEAFKKGASPHE
jgi:transposase